MTGDDIHSARLRLVLLDRPLIAALLEDDRERVEALLGASLPAAWPDERDRQLLSMRGRQMRDDPNSAPWLLRAIVLAETQAMIGHIGFHGPPDERAVVEVGYSVIPEQRRRGYAREAIEALLAWGRSRGAGGFRASVGPWNAPSLALVAQLGFQQTGVQWDEEDGEELVFEVPAQ